MLTHEMGDLLTKLDDPEVNEGNKLAILEEIKENWTPYDGRYILKYIFSSSPKIAHKTASTIRNLLTKKPHELMWVNLYQSYSFLNDVDLTEPHLFERLGHFSPEESAHLYGIASFNSNGYIREKALDHLQNLPPSDVLPYLLLRLNDWVPEVRDKARKVFLKNFSSLSLKNILKYYSLIEWLGITKRVNLSDIQDLSFTRLLHPRHREELLHALEQAPSKERLFGWKLLFKEIEKDSDFSNKAGGFWKTLFSTTTQERDLIDKAIRDKDPEVRAWATHHLPHDKNLNQRLKILTSDKASRVRYAALKRVPLEAFKEYEKIFKEALCETSKSFREYARSVFHSVNLKNDVRAFYQQRMSHDKVTIGTLLGFIDVSLKDDTPLIKILARHAHPKVRAEALEALSRLKAEGREEFYLLGIQDQSAKVRNTCVSILKQGYSHLRTPLVNLIEKSDPKSLKALLKVLAHYGGLEGLYAILFALGKTSEKLEALAWQYLLYWYKQWGIKPAGFDFNDETYRKVLSMLTELEKEKKAPPSYDIQKAWKDLPKILHLLRK